MRESGTADRRFKVEYADDGLNVAKETCHRVSELDNDSNDPSAEGGLSLLSRGPIHK